MMHAPMWRIPLMYVAVWSVGATACGGDQTGQPGDDAVESDTEGGDTTSTPDGVDDATSGTDTNDPDATTEPDATEPDVTDTDATSDPDATDTDATDPDTADADTTDTDTTGPTDPVACVDFPLARPPASPSTSSCGGEGQGPCTAGTPEFYENASAPCDRGLELVSGSCVNDTRHRAFIRDYVGGWEAWAVAFERDQLGFDEPLNWTMLLHAHNAYNNAADGYVAPNQYLSLSDQLDAGVRGINLDIVYEHARILLCHGDQGTGRCSAADRAITRALEEIRRWLDDNPRAIIVLRFEDRFQIPNGLYGLDLANGNLTLDWLLEQYFGGLLVPRASVADPNKSWPTRRELLARGQRVIVVRGGEKPETPFIWVQRAVTFWHDYQNCIPASQVGVATYPEAYGQTSKNWLTAQASEDRTIYAPFAGIIGSDVTAPLYDAIVRAQAECSPSQIELDYIFAAEHTPATWCASGALAGIDVCPDPDHRVAQTVWSFRPGDRGEGGPVFVNADFRWESGAGNVARRFACTRSADPIAPEDWWLSEPMGGFAGGAAACGSGAHFAAPVRYAQHRALTRVMRDANVTSTWINVQKSGAGWRINQREPSCFAESKSAPSCATSDDCYDHVPLNLDSAACCNGTCEQRLPDYLGVHYCPHECRISVNAPQGSCGGACYDYYTCGRDGQSACTIDKCFPSCADGLAEFGGQCTSGTCYQRWGCGADGQGACTIEKCFPSCADGLAEFGGQCTSGTCHERWGCGGEGQEPCTIDKCFPSCSGGRQQWSWNKCTMDCHDTFGCGDVGEEPCEFLQCGIPCKFGITNFGGMCHTDCHQRWGCGGAGQPACTVDKCIPSCRDGLVEINGQCHESCHNYWSCGGEGQSACTVDRCIPSCKPGLTEYGGRCTSGSCHNLHACGGEGQNACTIDRCTPSCKPGLTEYGGRCTSGSCHDLHACGGNGQSPCTIDRCFPSCKSGLVERNGKCLPPCLVNTARCSTGSECCSGRCYITTICPFGEHHYSDRTCCRDWLGNVDNNNCSWPTCGI